MLPTVEQCVAYLDKTGWSKTEHKAYNHVWIFTSPKKYLDDSERSIVTSFPKTAAVEDWQQCVTHLISLLGALEKLDDEEMVAKIKGEEVEN
jgi:uncharacterized protein with ParB-like and HNH nuclease domain